MSYINFFFSWGVGAVMLIGLQRGKVFVGGGPPKLTSLLSPLAMAAPVPGSLLGRMLLVELNPVEAWVADSGAKLKADTPPS